MTHAEDQGSLRGISRVAAAVAAVFLLPPFIALAIAPMLIMLVPVAIVGIPFMIPAFFSGTLSASLELRRVESWRPRALATQG